MERMFSRYIKAHGYAIAIAALTFGCIFAADVSRTGDLQKQVKLLDSEGAEVVDRTSQTYFRMRPLGQMLFSLVWILAGTVLLVGMLFEKKETIFPFATIFAVDWCVILIQHLIRLEHRSVHDVVMSAETAVLIVILMYVGFTLAVLFRLFDRHSLDESDCEDLESGRKPVKFSLGEEFDDSWIS